MSLAAGKSKSECTQKPESKKKKKKKRKRVLYGYSVPMNIEYTLALFELGK